MGNVKDVASLFLVEAGRNANRIKVGAHHFFLPVSGKDPNSHHSFAPCLLHEVFKSPGSDDSARKHDGIAIRVAFNLIKMVRSDEHSRAIFPSPMDHLPDPAPVNWVEACSGFVKKQNRRRCKQRKRKPEQLSVTTGKTTHACREDVRNVECSSHLADAVRHCAPRKASKSPKQGESFPASKFAEPQKMLRLVANHLLRLARSCRHRNTAHFDLPGCRTKEPRNLSHECCLSGTIRAHQTKEFRSMHL